ncbi:hypothetical protein KSC_034700 [Ktedonobacter sp. SOSP1-52]|uniref:DoxX family protein n=1 Tax=Ktedonobacter sp. SOSP1-52 TaxID=2778366 RepID=UPI001915B7B1|nr:DoxX family protein [Ktedonobacter sp. SOSP1-52]GHO64578.1 hypothetical protein KSC_034700 [Ktedonobacter sp. SOSP1-52]
MFVFMVLIIATLVFRGLGVLGVPLFQTWHGASLWALAVMLLLTASAHFTTRKEDLIKMVPRQILYPRQIVLVTGILEILGAIGLLIPFTRTAAGICLAILFVAVLPANINAALNAISLSGQPVMPLWLRVPMQVLFIALALWAALI